MQGELLREGRGSGAPGCRSQPLPAAWLWSQLHRGHLSPWQERQPPRSPGVHSLDSRAEALRPRGGLTSGGPSSPLPAAPPPHPTPIPRPPSSSPRPASMVHLGGGFLREGLPEAPSPGPRFPPSIPAPGPLGLGLPLASGVWTDPRRQREAEARSRSRGRRRRPRGLRLGGAGAEGAPPPARERQRPTDARTDTPTRPAAPPRGGGGAVRGAVRRPRGGMRPAPPPAPGRPGAASRAAGAEHGGGGGARGGRGGGAEGRRGRAERSGTRRPRAAAARMPRPAGRSAAGHPRGPRRPALGPGARELQPEPEAGAASWSPGRPKAG